MDSIDGQPANARGGSRVELTRRDLLGVAALGLVAGFAYTAPFEDLTLKSA